MASTDPSSSSFPVLSTTSSTQLVSGLKLDVVLSKFSDRILVVLTTIGKPGALYEVSKASANTDTARTAGLEVKGPKKHIYETRQLFGAQSTDSEVFSRAVAELFESDPVSRPVLVSLGLGKSVDLKVFREEIVPYVKSQVQV